MTDCDEEFSPYLAADRAGWLVNMWTLMSLRQGPCFVRSPWRQGCGGPAAGASVPALPAGFPHERVLPPWITEQQVSADNNLSERVPRRTDHATARSIQGCWTGDLALPGDQVQLPGRTRRPGLASRIRGRAAPSCSHA